MVEYLIHLIGRLGHWGYVVIFLGALLESAALLGLVVPGESLVLVAGFLAAQGLLDVDALIVVVAVGAVLGDSIGYELGRRLGRNGLLRIGSRFGLNEDRLARADKFFARHGGKAVLLGRFIGFARALVPFLAGSSRMPYRQFLPYNALGATLWSATAVLLGYFLGASWHVAERWIGRASAIIGGMVLLVLALSWLWRWAVHHEDRLRGLWQQWLTRPRIAALQLRFAPQIAFFHARLSRRSRLGLNLTVGALVLIGASWAFGAIAEDVVSGDPITTIDGEVARWFHARATPPVTALFLFITHVHGTIGILCMTLVLAMVLLWKRDWYWLLVVAITVPGGTALNILMKYAFHRARPHFDDPLLTLSTYGFPSGHMAAATLLYGTFAAILVVHVDSWRTRVLIALIAFLVVVFVGLSRIYLGVHFLSDALAAFAEGVAWLALCLTSINAFWQQDGRAHAKPL